MINRDTMMFGSFSKSPGNRGCSIFNSAFKYHGINAVYKSYQVRDITDAVAAARTLGFKGFAVSMPFKRDVIMHVDELSSGASLCGSANTVVNDHGSLIAYNTDYLAVKDFLTQKNILSAAKEGPFIILGDGAYAGAATRAANDLGISYSQINRSTWHLIDDIKKGVVFNCTPVRNIPLRSSNVLIDCLTDTETGRKLGIMQASHQYFLYTGRRLPFRYDA